MTLTSPSDRTPADEPLVSIGIPVWNAERYLREAVDSALAQRYANLEIILCDNASTDGTAAICREYAAADPRVRYHRNATNVGAVKNFELVLKLAHGKYFTWLAADDLLHPECLSTLVPFLERHDDVVACGSAIRHLDHNGPGTGFVQSFPEVHPDRPWSAARLEFFRWPAPPVAMLVYGVFRREILLRVPFQLETILLMPLSARGRVVALPQALRSYRHHPASEGAKVRDQAPLLRVVLIQLWMRLHILRNALTLRLPFRVRCATVAVALRNLANLTYRWGGDYRNLIPRLREEKAVLLEGCRQRRALVASLRAQAGLEPPKDTEATAEIEPPVRVLGRVRACARACFDWLTRVFLHPPQRERDEYHALKRDVLALRQQCADLLTEINNLSVSVLTKTLAAPDGSYRSAAARALGRLGVVAAAAAPALQRIRDDPDPEVRQAVAEALPRVAPAQ